MPMQKAHLASSCMFHSRRPCCYLSYCQGSRLRQTLHRYTNKQALTAIHQKSRPFLDFKERVRGLNTQTEGMSYLESGIGYM